MNVVKMHDGNFAFPWRGHFDAASFGAAEWLAAMTRAGGHPLGFGPFISSGNRLGEEHATWGNDTLHEGDMVFLELAGCVLRYHASRPSTFPV